MGRAKAPDPGLCYKKSMFKRVFYILAAILIVIWAVGFFVYALGALVHLLLILAILLIAFKIARSGKNKNQKPQSNYPRTYYRDKMEAERKKRQYD